MTNEIYTVGLSGTELQTIKVLLPITFPIIPCNTDLTPQAIEKFSDTARAIIINPKKTSTEVLTFFVSEQRIRIDNQQPVPILLLSDRPTREQLRAKILPEWVPVINLKDRINRARSLVIDILRESVFPCWQNREAMKANMFNDGWYLMDLETTGTDICRDQIVGIRIQRMANYELDGRPEILPIAQHPANAQIRRPYGREIPLKEAVDYLEELPCKNTPLVFVQEELTAGFLHTAYLRCGKEFQRPYVAIDKLANIPFGYLMQRDALQIPKDCTESEIPIDFMNDDPLYALYALTKEVFHALMERYGVHCPGEFSKLFAAQLSDDC